MPGPDHNPDPAPVLPVTSTSRATVEVPGYKQILLTGSMSIIIGGHSLASQERVSRLSGHGPADRLTISIVTTSPAVRPPKSYELPVWVPVWPVRIFTSTDAANGSVVQVNNTPLVFGVQLSTASDRFGTTSMFWVMR